MDAYEDDALLDGVVTADGHHHKRAPVIDPWKVGEALLKQVVADGNLSDESLMA